MGPDVGRRVLAALGAAAVLVACSGESASQRPAASGEGDPARGREAYLAFCVSCHGADPAKAGPVGPPIQGASRELLEARVVQGTYPPGYTPKRDSGVMQPIPQAAPYVGDLTAYLR